MPSYVLSVPNRISSLRIVSRPLCAERASQTTVLCSCPRRSSFERSGNSSVLGPKRLFLMGRRILALPSLPTERWDMLGLAFSSLEASAHLAISPGVDAAGGFPCRAAFPSRASSLASLFATLRSYLKMRPGTANYQLCGMLQARPARFGCNCGTVVAPCLVRIIDCL